jgi:glucose/arabinose dehydrogenase
MSRIPSHSRVLALGLAPLALGLTLAFHPGAPACDPDNGGLVLPPGFCAALVVSQAGGVRQLAVSSNGDPDQRASFGPDGANDVELHQGYLYVALNDRVLRFPMSPGKLEPSGKMETIVSGLPAAPGHRAKSLAFGAGGEMYVTIGSATNSCQKKDRQERSPGEDPCKELEQRAGIWQFSPDRSGQHLSDGKRFATGLRNPLALTTQPGTGKLFAAVHGRDQLGDNWGFSAEANANNPAEELVQINQGDDFGWPYCYYSNDQKKKVLAPEYGGDGKKVGRCASAKDPLMAFPGHWAPLALAFYNANLFGPEYKGGLFIAFHGSWNRAPLPQAGYRVVFVPSSGEKLGSEYSTFAAAKSGPTGLRASGLAVAPDGSLYISADDSQKIWRVSKKQ